MKKTTVRFAAVGTVLVLSALAIALAQHDSRQRARDAQPAAKPLPVAPRPILVDAIEPRFQGADRATGHTIDSAEAMAAPLVRANDDPGLGTLPALPLGSLSDATENPLRPAVGTPLDDQRAEPLGTLDDNSAVALASGEGEAASLPSNLSGLPSLPSALGAHSLGVQPLGAQSLNAQPQPTKSASGSLPSLPSTSPSLRSAPSSLPGSPPSLPSTAAAAPSSAASGTSSNAADAANTAPPGWVNSSPLPPKQSLANQSLSDTQRPAMPATSLSQGSLSQGSRAGQQPWLQAPSMPNSPASNSRGGGLPASGASPAGTSALSDGPSTTAESLGGRPLAPSASLGTPEPYAKPYAAPPAVTDDYQQDSPPRTGLSRPQPSSLPDSLPSTQPPGMASAQPRGQLTSGAPRSLLAGTALGSLVSNQPGNRHLDGSQNPIMLIQKRTAGECQVGKPATIVITVRNSGNATAHDVQVIDSVPSGASFAEAIPAVTPTPEGVLVWQLGEMAPGDERTINLQIIPERQGELGSVASVRFAAQASVRTLATLPKIELAYTSPPDALIGSQHAIDVVVKNVGTGVARNVRLEADLPTNIRHESGDAGLEASFGDIAPGESKNIRLNAIAAEAGNGLCTIRALTDDGLQQEQKIDVQVLAPALQASINGPSKRYLDRQATFEIMIQNTGTAPATNCEFMLRLPAGLNFNTANNHGTYKADEHAVLWSLPELPAGETGTVELTVLPVEVGTLAMTFQATAELGVKAEARGELSVEEQAELAFTIEQDADPIELSASTTYTVEVRNIGRVDHQVQLTVQLPPGSKILKVDPPVRYSIQGDQLLFEPVPEMQSRTGHKFRFEVQHAQVGTQIVRAQLKSQNRPTPVIKEEATDVYNDRN